MNLYTAMPGPCVLGLPEAIHEWKPEAEIREPTVFM